MPRAILELLLLFGRNIYWCKAYFMGSSSHLPAVCPQNNLIFQEGLILVEDTNGLTKNGAFFTRAKPIFQVKDHIWQSINRPLSFYPVSEFYYLLSIFVSTKIEAGCPHFNIYWSLPIEWVFLSRLYSCCTDTRTDDGTDSTDCNSTDTVSTGTDNSTGPFTSHYLVWWI